MHKNKGLTILNVSNEHHQISSNHPLLLNNNKSSSSIHYMMIYRTIQVYYSNKSHVFKKIMRVKVQVNEFD